MFRIRVLNLVAIFHSNSNSRETALVPQQKSIATIDRVENTLAGQLMSTADSIMNAERFFNGERHFPRELRAKQSNLPHNKS